MGKGLLTSKICLLNFYLPHWDVGPAHSTILDECGFFNSIVVKLLCNLISDDTECWLYNLVLILMWLCKEASRVYLCCHLGVYLFKQLSTKINTILNC